jgi:hypothetical protein
MYSLTLNRELLGFIVLFKAMQKMFHAQAMYMRHMDERLDRKPKQERAEWYDLLKEWFYTQPPEEMQSLGIKKNDLTFAALVNLQIPEAWLSTLFSELDQFEFKV